MGIQAKPVGSKIMVGVSPFEKTRFSKFSRPSQSTVEAEAVAGLGLLVQATNLMATGTAEIDTNTPDQCRLLHKYSGSVSIGQTLRPCLLP